MEVRVMTVSGCSLHDLRLEDVAAAQICRPFVDSLERN
jgi:hypothetical protein